MSSRRPRPLVIAHRGASGHRPENTLSAYELAVEQRADMIEIDLHRTRDAATVITHDEKLDALGGSGEIAERSFSEIRSLDAGDGQQIPTLDEVLDGFAGRIPFNLELKKSTTGPYPGLESTALEAVTRRGLLGETLFSSFSDPVLSELRGLSTHARLALLISPENSEGWMKRAAALGAEAVNPWRGITTPELIAEAHGAGLAVHVFTVNEVEDMARLLDWKVDGMFTNYPDQLRRLVDRRDVNPELNR